MERVASEVHAQLQQLITGRLVNLSCIGSSFDAVARPALLTKSPRIRDSLVALQSPLMTLSKLKGLVPNSKIQLKVSRILSYAA